ncbi:MAG: ABC transporter permease [Cyanophyceae cyanobacterium]
MNRVSVGRVGAIAANVVREQWRAKVSYFLAAYGLVLVLALALLPEIAAGNTTGKILLDIVLAGASLMGLAVAVFTGTRLLDREIERLTILLSIAKPLSRTEFILGKHLGLSVVLIVVALAATGMGLVALLPTGQVENLDWEAIGVTTIFALVELVLLAAIALLFSVITNGILASGLTLAVYFMGHLSQDLLTIGVQLDTPWLRRLTEILYIILPDLERLNLKNLAVYGILPDVGTLGLNALYGAGYTVIVLCLTTFIFARREF